MNRVYFHFDREHTFMDFSDEDFQVISKDYYAHSSRIIPDGILDWYGTKSGFMNKFEHHLPSYQRRKKITASIESLLNE